MLATAGLLLLIWKIWSVFEGEARVTTANEPLCPLVEVGLSVIAAGCACGRTVSCDCGLPPFQLAVSVARVLAATWLVWIVVLTDELPAGTVTSAGACAAGESLLRETTAPPAGACPFSITIAPVCAPPVMELVFTVNALSEGGSTLNCTEADPELSVAVMVTGVGEVTCPACIWNCIHAVLPGMVTVAGTGAAFGSELVRLTTAPAAEAAPLSCSCTHVPLPLYRGLLVSVSETGAGGAGLTVKVPVADHAVTAAVVVTGLGEVTCPARIWNCIHAVLPGMVTVAGTGAAFGSELVRLTTAPAAEAAPLSCSCTHVPLPLYRGLLVSVSETGAGGAGLTVKVPVADHAVTAAVVVEASP